SESSATRKDREISTHAPHGYGRHRSPALPAARPATLALPRALSPGPCARRGSQADGGERRLSEVGAAQRARHSLAGSALPALFLCRSSPPPWGRPEDHWRPSRIAESTCV